MKLTFTDSAIEKLKNKKMNPNKLLKLKYDTEGCGCVVSGVAALWLVNQQGSDDIVIETNYRSVLVEKSKLVFFDDDMKIDTVETANCFMLKSPNQIFNPRMTFVEKSDDEYEQQA
ncbi:iron-sulfur cluster biosynthesis family protein [Cytobacillus sp. S13-E01]|uniref:iron-sulfur cluster biosynthesis family protein n=1 Tax=Cytobacillus sp. S13-E01 TaxID=3031326 RepID=UPI0023D80899|nr:iron-sulfur cluster biosynthesis family protein [Cytobacillus sp. S13-E01]MDF0726120.1 iron-sulfur cluster biosynthesis family protein [Cytobacillus sp. S13-E01]